MALNVMVLFVNSGNDQIHKHKCVVMVAVLA